jgi:H+/gluconate symporter-like permease
VSSGSEPDVPASRPHPFVAAIPLVSVVSLNLWFTSVIPAHYPARFNFQSSGIASDTPLDTVPFRALWPIECALVIAIVFVLPWCLPVGGQVFRAALNHAIAGATLATFNVGSEYGFGAVIASLPGFKPQAKVLHPLSAIHW